MTATALPPPDADEDELKGSEAPLLEHLIELRKRLIYSLAAVVVLFILCFIVAKPIYDILVQPFIWAGGKNMIYTAPQEFFFTQMNVALFGALFFAFPIIAGQIYAFVAPGLYKRERRAFIPYLVATPVFFLLGAVLVYFVVAPMALHFFLGMQQTTGDVQIEMQTRVSEYLGFIMTLIIAFGICFQLPVILTLLARIELVNSKQLGKGRKYAIVGILAIAALLSPPDPISQIGLSIPMYALYEFSIFAVRWVEKQRAQRDAAEAAKA
ncbi:MAG: twin arginine-targeting protein translocase TatC [Devosia sp. 67-54]|uniref:twin-arginine translocase subunit TatC n=1 Tax=unclassified Devosia TaxID=196773 RepID=UPI000963E585|nr:MULTISPECIES: twin-arginine translocase subunit TatC [unclassified Devosia]MBN9304160.1 twin-arginine translocase subunit TatC [Devosia sp.]OJX17985.1 MAG: twin arginine-targeting protein translocase TatC [Devosia sp. 67-54]